MAATTSGESVDSASDNKRTSGSDCSLASSSRHQICARRPERFHFEQLVEDLHRFLAAREVERCDLIGHSLGGMVSLRFALEHPERLRSLLLMDTSPFAPDGYSLASFEKAGAIAQARGMAFLQQRVERAARADPSPQPADRRSRSYV